MYLLTEVDAYQYEGVQTPYILDIVPLPSGLASISTDQKLCLLDPLRLSSGPKRTLQTSHRNITALKVFDFGACVVATAGENGTITLWDLRDSATQGQVTVQAGSCSYLYVGDQVAQKPSDSSPGSCDDSLISLACENRTQSVAAGTEYANHQASIKIW